MFNILKPFIKIIEDLYLGVQFVSVSLSLVMINFLSSENIRTNISSSVVYFLYIASVYLVFKVALHVKKEYLSNSGSSSSPSVLLAVVDGFFIYTFIYISSGDFNYIYLLTYLYIVFQSVRFPSKSMLFSLGVSAVYVLVVWLKGFDSLLSLRMLSVSLFSFNFLSYVISFIFREIYVLSHQLESTLEEVNRENTKLKILASKDYLTNMYNHKFFKEKYSELLGSSSGTVHSLALIDIDDFKKVNDTYGHTTGDYVLREISAIIRSSIRVSDIAARYGGEEFAILFPETSKSEGKIICERIRAEIESHVFVFNKFQFGVTISCGLSCTMSQQSEPTEVLFLESVDKLLYKAKHLGKNRVIYS